MDLSPQEVTVSGGSSDLDSVISFTCPACGVNVVRAVQAKAVGLLRACGCGERPAMPITEAEIHEFAAGLDCLSCLDELHGTDGADGP